MLVMIATAQRAVSCSCSPAPPAAQELRQSDAVFAGRCVAGRLLSDEQVEFTFEVLRTWKGTGRAKRLTVTTHPDSGMCGYPFSVGTAYIVYCGRAGGGFANRACSRTRAYRGIWGEDEERALDAATRKRRKT